MSVIVDCVLLVGTIENSERMREVNDRLHVVDRDRHQDFRLLDEHGAGGTKVMCTNVWAAAFNHLSPSVIRAAIAEAEWVFPEEVVYAERSGDYELPLAAITVVDLREHLLDEATGRQ